MRAFGVRALLIYCTDYHCSHSTTISADACDQWGDDIRLSDLEPKFTCKACGKKGADVRPDFEDARALPEKPDHHTFEVVVRALPKLNARNARSFVTRPSLSGHGAQGRAL